MIFNPDPSKQAQEVIFRRKLNKDYHPHLAFNNNNVTEHLKIILNKVNKTVELLRKLHNILLKPALLTIYKRFIRSHLDYGDLIYDQAYNISFHQKLELLQYNACLGITGAIRGTSREKLYEELVRNPSDYVVGSENYLFFTNSSTVNIPIISSN